MAKKTLFWSVLSIVCGLMCTHVTYAQMAVESLPGAISEQKPLIGKGKPYTLGKTDVVEITVRNQPEFSGTFEIGPDGKIQYSFIGDIRAEGLTKEELKRVIEDRLTTYVKTPEVSVAISAYRSKIVYILGEVGRPGKYPLRGDSIPLREAIAEAGLPTRAAALRRIYIVKPDEENPSYRKIDLYKLLYKGITKDNVELVSGDIVVVPSTVPSEINRALTNLLSPVLQAREADVMRTYRWGASDED
jgi:polysaccharide export outer membrane protein